MDDGEAVEVKLFDDVVFTVLQSDDLTADLADRVSTSVYISHRYTTNPA